MDSHMEAVSNRLLNGNRTETMLTQASVHTPRGSSNLSHNVHSEPHSSMFKYCTRKEKLSSPNENKKDDLKYIDEEGTINLSSETLLENTSTNQRITAVPITPVGVSVSSAPISDTMIRSCSVGYLDIVNSQLVPCEVTLAMLRKDAPKRLVLVNKKNKNNINKRNFRKQHNPNPQLNLKLDTKTINNGCMKTPHLKSCGKSKSLDSSEMFLMTYALNEVPTLPASIEEPIKSPIQQNEYETIESIKPINISNEKTEPITVNTPTKNTKECTKLSFFTSSKTPLMNRKKRRDLPVCESCKCVTPSSNTNPVNENSNSESYICNACSTSSACNTPTKKSKGLFTRDRNSPGSDKSRSSSPRRSNNNDGGNNSEIEIGKYATLK